MPDPPCGRFPRKRGSRLERRSYSGFVEMTKPPLQQFISETSAFTFKLCCTFLTGFALRRIRKTGFHLYPDRLVTVFGWAQAREHYVSITRYYRHGRHQCSRP